MVPLTLQFDKSPKLKFEDFLTVSLKFLQLKGNKEGERDVGVRNHDSSSRISSNFCSQATAENFSDYTKLNNTERMEIDDDGARRNVKDSFFFYGDENYFKGVMIRLKHIDQLHIALKVYLRHDERQDLNKNLDNDFIFRSNHQLVTFIKAIYGKYSERCLIKVEHNNNQQNCNLIKKQNSEDFG